MKKPTKSKKATSKTEAELQQEIAQIEELLNVKLSDKQKDVIQSEHNSGVMSLQPGPIPRTVGLEAQIAKEGEKCSDPTILPVQNVAPSIPVATRVPASAVTQAEIDNFLVQKRSEESGLSGLLKKHSKKGAPSTIPDGPIAGRIPTPEQKAILEAALKMANNKTGIQCLVIEAGAGTGKTATLQMLEQVLPGQGQYTAFNTSLCNESRTKFTKASVNTTHSLAFRAEGVKYSHRLGGQRVRSYEIAARLGIEPLILDLGPKPDEPEKRWQKVLQPQFLAGQIMSALRLFRQSKDARISKEHFQYIDAIDQPIPGGGRCYANNDLAVGHMLPFAEKVWDDVIDPKGTMPFAHDDYVKIWASNHPYISADYILLDEDQDTSEVMVEILKMQTHALLILVGDENQSIYSWRGANVNAARAFPESERLFLTQSFRFGQQIADVANSILAALYEPTELKLKGLPTIPSQVNPPYPYELDCILCRTNAAAVKYVLNLQRDGKHPHLIGNGTEIIAFAKAARDLKNGRGTSHPELCCFTSWKEVEEYSKQSEGEDLALNVRLVNEFTVEAILKALEQMPDEKDADIVICTAHKSKGREWGNVKLAGDFPPMNKMDDEGIRLLYVAATRAKYILNITECAPFTCRRDRDGNSVQVIEVKFTGPAPTKEELEKYLASKGQEPKKVDSASTSKPTIDPTIFTWSKGKQGGWLVRGPSGKVNQSVNVVRRDGSSQSITLKKVVWEEAGISLYSV